MSAGIYGARAIKRPRRTKEQMSSDDDALRSIVEHYQPLGVRGTYYRAEVRGVFSKTQSDYRKVQRSLLKLRRDGRIPYSAITDGTRWRRKPPTHSSIEAALMETAHAYRRALWRSQGVYVEVWIEKDALAGTVYPVTSQWDVPLLVSRGFSSESFLYSAGMEIQEQGLPAFVYVMTDFDHSGDNIYRQIAEGLPPFCGEVPITVERLALTERQVEWMRLPVRPPKPIDRAHGFTFCCELDAMEPDVMRGLVEAAIERHVDESQLHATMMTEQLERQIAGELAEWLERRS